MKLTRKQAAIMGAFTGVVCGPFEDMREYVEAFPQFKGLMTHNYASKEVADAIKEASHADFIAICPDRDDPK